MVSTQPGEGRKRRRWSSVEKLDILQETKHPGANISSIARKYDISPRLLFSWLEKQVHQSDTVMLPSTLKHGERENTPPTFIELERIQSLILQNLEADLRKKKISSYSAACALSSLVNAAAKLAVLKLDLLDKVRTDEIVPEAVEEGFHNPSKAARLEAERMVYALVKSRVEEKERLRLLSQDS